jgi:hypothetical protein
VARKHSLHLLELPNKVLIEICRSIDQDLHNVRLTCRQLCDAGTQQFAIDNFTERIHVVTPYSIGALIHITEHPNFGRYVRIVGICSARCTARVKNLRPVAFNGYVTTKRFARDMERVFTNIKSLSGSMTITIYDSPGVGDIEFWAGSRQASHPTQIKCHGWQDLLKLSYPYIQYRTAETLEQTVYAARRARCKLTRLKMYLFAGYISVARAQLHQAMQEILESTLAPLSVDLGRNGLPRLSCDSRSKSVELRNIHYVNSTMNTGYNIPMDALCAWLYSQIIVRAKVDSIYSYTPECLQHTIFTPHLKYLDLSRMLAWTDHFDQNLWSETIRLFSGIPNLQYCRLSKLTYCINLAWGDDLTQHFTLPGHGAFRCAVSEFKLLFPNGATTFETTGDIRNELHDLANYVRAAENSKRQIIISDGFVRNGTVGGIIQDSGE